MIMKISDERDKFFQKERERRKSDITLNWLSQKHIFNTMYQSSLACDRRLEVKVSQSIN